MAVPSSYASEASDKASDSGKEGFEPVALETAGSRRRSFTLSVAASAQSAGQLQRASAGKGGFAPDHDTVTEAGKGERAT